MSFAFEVIRSYFENPRGSWPDSNPRQADKLDARVRAIAQKTGLDTSSIAEQIVHMAAQRVEQRSRTIHIANIGSSGSHWLEAVLADAGITLNGGEIYFPQSISEISDAIERRLVVESIQLLHAGPRIMKASNHLLAMSNSAHSPVFAHPGCMGDDLIEILLVRDPLDVVLSRTFRKDEYRKYVSEGADDAAYLDSNASKVSSFYARALNKGKYRAIVHYENLKHDLSSSVIRLVETLSIEFDRDVIESASAAHSRDSIEKGKSRVTSNLYLGPTTEIPDSLKSRAIEMLEPIRRELGYL